MALIKNRQILFSNREQYLGTTYDHSSNHMVFRTGRINDDGMDLADMTFNVVLKYSDTNATDTDTATVDVSDQYIDIIWTIASSVMTHEGTNLIQLQAFDESGTFKWSTFQEVIYIENALTNVPSSASLSALETLESRIAYVVSSESSRVTAEAARVTAETARAGAESSRVTAENARVTAETARSTAEASRVSTFTSNETSRANTFTASEASRASTFTASEASRDARVTALETGYTETSLLAKSYAVGGTGTRAGEDTDNAKYYKEQAQSTSVGSLNYEEEKIHFGDTDSTTDGGDVTSIVAQDTNGVAKAYTVKDSEARTSALNAQDAADAAQSTANTAASNASAAQSTANTAVSNAAAAQSTANTAVSNAAAAQSTANTAASNAATAQTTADNAQTAADARVKYTDALTLEEIAASTDLTNKVAGAGAVKSLNQSLANNAKVEVLWSDDSGVSDGTQIVFDKKGYKVFAFNTDGGALAFGRAYSETLSGITCGTSVPLWNGSYYIGACRGILFDSYPTHFYIQKCGDFTFDGSYYQRRIYAIYGFATG